MTGMIDNKDERIPYRNSEGYPDPTVHAALSRMMRRPLAPPPGKPDEDEIDRRARLLVNALRNMIDLAGFEPLQRFELRDRVSGRIYR